MTMVMGYALAAQDFITNNLKASAQTSLDQPLSPRIDWFSPCVVQYVQKKTVQILWLRRFDVITA